MTPEGAKLFVSGVLDGMYDVFDLKLWQGRTCKLIFAVY